MQEQIICNKEDLTAIADAVRASNGSTETYNVPELSVAAIEAIGSGGGSLELDTTLKVAGKAADAGAVGEALNELKEANAQQDQRLTTLERNTPSGTSGLTVGLKNALENYFTNIQTLITQMTFNRPDHIGAALVADAKAIVAALNTASEEPGQPESGIVQIGNVLAITSGVTVTQTGTMLAIA